MTEPSLTSPPEPNEALLAAAEASKGMFRASPQPLHLGSYTDPFKVDWTLYEDGSVMRVAPDGTSHVSYVDAPVVVILKILRRADPTLKEAFAAKFNFPVI